MELKTKNHLIEQYNKLCPREKKSCLKYHYLYNNVNVNVFFDAYERESLSFCLILAYKRNYYYTSLNIEDSTIHTEYLNEVPTEILARIISDNHLVKFYESMETHILSEIPIVNYGYNDLVFKKTMKNPSRNKADLPFWSNVRRVRMSDKTLDKFSASAAISRKTLIELQNRNLTLVRTDKPIRRRKLTVILESVGITLS